MPVKNDREYRNFEMLKRAAQEGEEKDYIVEELKHLKLLMKD